MDAFGAGLEPNENDISDEAAGVSVAFWPNEKLNCVGLSDIRIYILL